MSDLPKLIIPKVDNVDKLYIYRSLNANDINTISKVSNLEPIIIIDQSQASAEMNNDMNKLCYTIEDAPTNEIGITYNGPQVNNVPINEYETDVNLVMINPYTPINELILSPLEITHKNGIMIYYSIIGVVNDSDRITHLSKVSGGLYPYAEQENIVRQVWSCEDYNDSEDDNWVLVASLPYDETNDTIRIGDITRPFNIQTLGIPVIETVPSIQEINVNLNSLVSNTFMLLEIQNPWQNNNKYFNYRELKSYKIRNVYGSTYGEFSVPTYQSKLPVSIEKMIILVKENPSDPDALLNENDEGVNKYEIIRRDGLYYNRKEHKTLGYNQWTIPLETNKLSVYSETSIHDYINMQITATSGNIYSIDVYLIDAYKNSSNYKHLTIET